jgi:16S rRNA (guanine527-N7)-methyltransferase
MNVSLACRTGNGLPGIPLAIAHPHSEFSLVESSEKKAKVVQQIVEALHLPNVTVINTRAEQLPDKFDFVVGRAVAPLPVFLKNVFRLCKKKSSDLEQAANGRQGNAKTFGPGLFYIKGGDFEEELGQAGVRKFRQYQMRDLSHHALNDSDKKVMIDEYIYLYFVCYLLLNACMHHNVPYYLTCFCYCVR